jgi:spore germination protein GerM
MRGIPGALLNGMGRFFARARNRRVIYLAVLAVCALGEVIIAGSLRQTFVFYAPGRDIEALEERMIRRSSTKEAAIRRYVEEALLGPVSPDLAPLFPRETALHSLLLRDGVVYVNLSLTAALAAAEGVDSFRNLYVLNAGIRRNFRYVKDVRLFIEGTEAYHERFREVFTGNSGKKSKSV